MAGIFVNYRRDDAPGMAGRLFDHLARRFSRRRIFMDVDAMKPGRDFVKQLDDQVSQCAALLAIIGPRWLDAMDDKGHRRLDAERDYVRIEIAAALKRDIPVIPVLVDGADMPAEDDLPEDLKSLARRHALELRHTRFAADGDAIVDALNSALPRQGRRWLWPGAGAALAAACIAGVIAAWPLLSGPFRGNAKPAAAVASITGMTRSAADEVAPRGVRIPTPMLAPPQAETPATPAIQASVPATIETLAVALGDTFDQVKAVYPSAADVGGGDLSLPLDGIRFLFNRIDRRLRTIRADAPFGGSIQGVHIGDAAKDIVARLGQPSSVTSNDDDTIYVYNLNGDIVRFDFDKSSKVATIRQIRETK